MRISKEASVTQRVTQRRIAELAGVSQTTVSLVLNGKEDAARIPEATRQRVLDVINETTYVADPAARRLAGQGNNLVGIFTYEHAFPSETSDFYTPLLTGIESAAEHLGLDLLLFTSAPVVDGRRQILHERSRLRLADGCLLLGREMDADELRRLLESGYPFVAVGRRDIEGVPWVGFDYKSASAGLAERIIQAGHRRAVYVHLSLSAESSRDRRDGLTQRLESSEVELESILITQSSVSGVLDRVAELGATVLIVEDPTVAEELHAALRERGVMVPAQLSMVVLGERSRPQDRAIDFTRLSAPRIELGSTSIALLHQILNGVPESAPPLPEQRLLPCALIDGSTLAEVAAR
jgi:DNA-binding LacI/PurR family transcriptional regulator